MFINQMKHKPPLWENFKCQRCGNCCEGDLPWDPWRLEEIATFLNITINELINTYYGEISSDGSSINFDDSKRTPCPFNKKEGGINKCIIYPVRPLGCSLFPFDSDGGTAGIDCPAAKIAYDKVRAGQTR